MFKFLRAKHRSNYFQLAWKYKLWPERVYNLAHGSRAKTEKEKKVIHDLLNLGIIHRHQNKHDGLLYT